MAVLARDLVDSCVYAMAERYRLNDVGARSPRPLRQAYSGDSAHEQEQRDGNQYAVHRLKFRSHHGCSAQADPESDKLLRGKCGAQVTSRPFEVNGNDQRASTDPNCISPADHKPKNN
jgi:hypothetical protein